jgi:A/G-specific adenine glycosylase
MLAMSEIQSVLIQWYEHNARDLPWRRPGTSAWGVLVSEIMLAQTPVARVEPSWTDWMHRWPSPAHLAAERTSEVIRRWDRLGYPRRALWLQEAAQACVDRFDGDVPSTYDELRSLRGVGDYTASAVLAFAFGRRAIVLDTNVRRVITRIWAGLENPAPHITSAERQQAAELAPVDDAAAAMWAISVMEFGALVCTAVNPGCDQCPVRADCAWNISGRPPGPPRRTQKFEGTDRQVRGKLMAVLRAASSPVPRSTLDLVWPDSVQRARALDSLVADGLVDPIDDEHFALP